MDATFLHFLCFTCSIFLLSTAFTPQDIYLINCGSSTSNVAIQNRYFVGDSSKNSTAHLSESGKSFALKNPRPYSRSSSLSSSARVFTSASTYAFNISSIGTHLVRLHFYPFKYGDYDLRKGSFSVLANGVSLLSSFGANFTVIKEFFLMVDKVELQILFSPLSDSNFAFINAIEVFSAPKSLFIDNGAVSLIGPNGIQEFKQNISSQILETFHRVNVGGPSLMSENDTVWRSWVSDEDFLVLKSAAKTAETNDLPYHHPGGATIEHAPDSVYMTARQMNVINGTWSLFNVTWDFPVYEDSVYFVRLHFCDIVSEELDSLYFNVYINGFAAYTDVDLSVLSFHHLASPCYVDFIVKNKKDSGVLRISIGPSDLSTSRKNAILNGVEIMRVVNLVDSRTSLKKVKTIWISVVSLVGGFFSLSMVFMAIIAVFKCRKRKPKPRTCALASPGPYGYYDLKIPLADIQLATNNFDKNLVIGSGGFGMVYKGVLRDGTRVAVKRGVPGSGQGLPEFRAEIAVLSKIRHRHLVSLVGFCDEQTEMILVYESIERGPLRRHLYGPGLLSPPLSWKQRLEICIGAARGLHYLHTGPAQVGFIHRDIKSTNILLDENWAAKVSDFGLSRPGPCPDETHVSTHVKGSFGYLDPEYFRRQCLTEKSDVYSFGVVLFEVLCARPVADPLLTGEEEGLVQWAVERWKKGAVLEIVDPHLVGRIESGSLRVFVETAEKCVAECGVDRPTMGDVLWNLERAYRLSDCVGDATF